MFLRLLLLIHLVIAHKPNLMIHLQHLKKHNVDTIKKNWLIYKYTISDKIKNTWITDFEKCMYTKHLRPMDEHDTHLFVHIMSFI